MHDPARTAVRHGDEAGMLEAELQFRRIIGYRDLARLAVAIERDLTPAIPT